jgi:Cof subfamily protein (haloacid dehalogenase superfamily)
MGKAYKLLVTDIDGTLTNSDGIMSEIDLNALRAIHRDGVRVSLSTGRAVAGCRAVLEEVSMDGFHIFFDGALVANTKLNKEIYRRPIQKPLLGKVCNLAQSQGIALELFSQTGFFVRKSNPLSDLHGQLMNFQPSVADLNIVCKREIIMLGCLVIAARDEKRILSLCARLGDGLRFGSSWHPACPEIRFINITSKGVSKGEALEALIIHLGLSKEDVVAIGDGANDIPLLSNAGFAIAMENGPEELKEIADYITSDVGHNGVAQAINYIFRR